MTPSLRLGGGETRARVKSTRRVMGGSQRLQSQFICSVIRYGQYVHALAV